MLGSTSYGWHDATDIEADEPMVEDAHISFARLFESWVKRYVEPRSASARERLIEQLVRHVGDYSQDYETGRLFVRLRTNLTSEEFANLPQTAHEVLRGVSITFSSDEERKQQYEARQQAERQREAEQSRREEERRRELQRFRENRERERQRSIEQRRKAEALRREREAERQRRQAIYDAELARLQSDRERLQRLKDRLDLHNTKPNSRIHERLHEDFLRFDRLIAAKWLSLVRATGFYEHQKMRFVSHWATERYGLPLDQEQAAAVGAVNRNVLVTARAGSGKTRVLTTRAIFLHQHCGVPANRIMLLAFNRRAASEMESRLREYLGDNIPHVMTFHALAFALVHPREDLLYDDKDEGKQHLSEVTQQVIDEHVRSERWANRIKSLMLEHFEADWNRIETGGYNLSGQEFLDFRYSLQSETLNGERVRNFGQKAIANLLVEYDIPYTFGPRARIRWGQRQLSADFVNYKDGRDPLFIRGIEEGGGDDSEGWEKLKSSIAAKKFKGYLLEYHYETLRELGKDAFAQLLLSDLREYGLRPRHLNQDKLWLKVRDRAVDRFTKAMANFVGRCRQRAWTNHDLEQAAIQRKASPDVTHHEIEFYRIGNSVYKEYLGRLHQANLEDFNGLMLRAAHTVRDGTTTFLRKGDPGDIRDIDYLHIDEYQDFSRSFYDLTSAMRMTNPKMNVFAVGDDWQAINGFAGSDLTYFHDFDEHFLNTRHLSITRNYRSHKRIVDASNALLTEDDEFAKAVNEEDGVVQVCSLDEFDPTRLEREILGARKSGGYSDSDEYEIAVARIAQEVARKGEVALLNRTRDPDVVAGSTPKAAQTALRELLGEELRENVAVDTAHSYKGLERDAVVILDAVANHYPLIHPHWIFGQIFGDTLKSIEAAELRLFYVAVSRARDRLIICTQDSKRSSFLDTIQSVCDFPTLDVNELPPVIRNDSHRYEVRVLNSYEVRELLMKEDFTFVPGSDSQLSHWSSVMPAEEVTLDWIDKAPWNDGNVIIEVYDQTNKRIWSLTDGGDASALASADPF